MFDQAMEVIADDVANKVGEMERFMEMSSNFMNSIDLQNGVFEEQGLKMLEDYEKNSTLLLLGVKKKWMTKFLNSNNRIYRPAAMVQSMMACLIHNFGLFSTCQCNLYW
jgi:hypothetical protein